jgi:curli biogenesis system outer membrane secretion channel CsgG
MQEAARKPLKTVVGYSKLTGKAQSVFLGERTMKRYLIAGLCISVLLAAGIASHAAEAKKRVALMDFDYGTVTHWWSGYWDIGKGISDLIVTELVTDGTFSVIERKKLDTVLQEQNFSNSDRANPTSAAQIGKVLGVNAIVVGTVTQFGMDDKSLDIGGIARTFGGFGRGKVGKKEGKATVVIDARLVDVNTGEILAVASGKGSSKRSGLLLGGAGGSGGSGGGGGVDMSSSNFRDTILGEATREAVQKLSEQLVEQSGKVQATAVVIEGLVADATGGIIIINVGTNAGVSVGMKLVVERVVREIKDPATGQPLRKITNQVGEIEITEADAASAVARIISGEGFKVGDVVKNK